MDDRILRRKRVQGAALAVALAVAGASLVVAQDDAKDGKTLFKEYCKPCHGVAAKAGEYTPMTLIGDQWDRFFRSRYEDTHKGALVSAHGDRPLTEVLTPEKLKTLQEWIVDHAADSEHPMTCG